MSTAPPPSKKPPPPAPARQASTADIVPAKSHKIQSGRQTSAQRIVLFGTAAIGKTELAANIGQVGIKPLFFDIERGSGNLEVDRIADIDTFDDLRSGLQDFELLNNYGAVVIDSGTMAQELCEKWCVANIKTEKGNSVKSISEYPYGKGLEYTYDVFLRLLSDLDAQIRRNRHVIVICHQCTELVPNSQGEDFWQYQPRLQLPKSGKNSIRHRLIEWCDHIFFLGYDRAVDRDGKAVGSGSRTIYTSELPAYLAKSRKLSEPIVYEKGSAELWKQLFSTGE